jgi:chromosome partitioning protein
MTTWKDKIFGTLAANAPKALVVGVVNQKGGVGKTTLAFELAHAYFALGKKVLVIDFDPQANMTELLRSSHDDDVPESTSIYQLLVNQQRELKNFHRPLLLSEAIEKSASGCDFLASSPELAQLEMVISTVQAPRPLLLKKLLSKQNLLSLYDVIVIDCPPTLGLLVVNAMCASDVLAVPMRADQFSKRGLDLIEECLLDIEDMELEGVHPQVRALCPNLVDLRRKNESDFLTELRQHQWAEWIVPPLMNRANLGKLSQTKKSCFHFKGQDAVVLQQYFLDLAQQLAGEKKFNETHLEEVRL